MHPVIAITPMLLAATLLATAAPAIAASCTVDPQDLTLGAYDPLAMAPQDAVAYITVTCDAATPFVVTLGPGSGDYVARTMRGGGQSLRYNLFLDASRSTVWGDGSNGSGSLSQTGTGGTFPVYARAPGRQTDLRAGTYSDSITVTVTY